MYLLQDYQDGMVVARSNISGVWFGRLKGWEGAHVRLATARRAWAWEGAGDCSVLAAIGPTGGNIGPEVDTVVFDCCEVIKATDVAIKAWDRVPVWTAR
jgi:hypothetical protein